MLPNLTKTFSLLTESMLISFSQENVFQKLSQQPNRGLNHFLYRNYQTFPLTLDKYCTETTGVVYSKNRSKLLPSPRAETEQNDDARSSVAVLLSDSAGKTFGSAANGAGFCCCSCCRCCCCSWCRFCCSSCRCRIAGGL